jgi:hypothetical protein
MAIVKTIDIQIYVAIDRERETTISLKVRLLYPAKIEQGMLKR